MSIKKQGRIFRESRGNRKKGRKKQNLSKKEENYPYFVSLFHIGPYDRKKSPQIK